MNDDLVDYFRAIRQRSGVQRREWYWPKNAHRPKWLAYTLEYEPITLLLKIIQYVRRRRALAPLTRSQRPSAPVSVTQLQVRPDVERRGAFEVEVPANGTHDAASIVAANASMISSSGPLSSWERVRVISNAGARSSAPNHPHSFAEGERTRAQRPLHREVIRLPAAHRRLIFAHLYFEAEAQIIFDKLAAFPDYDQIVTTSVPSLRDAFLGRADPRHAACLLVPNVGRDVLPFLLSLAAIDLSGYDQFVKVHTKRSVHLAHGTDWFGMNVDALLGNKTMTDRLLDQIDPHTPSIYGLQVAPLRDHIVQNRHWLRHLTGTHAAFLRGSFIPGTMFAGSGQFLRELASLNLHLQRPEPEAGQLDGTLVHALERFFGYFAESRGGECRSIESLLISAPA